MEDNQSQVNGAKYDVASLIPDSNEFEFEISNPHTKKKTGIYVTVLSRDSDTYKELQRAQQNARFKSFGRRTTSSSLTAEELEEENIQILIACTKAWRNMILHGQELECNPANVRKVYETVNAIREQVDDAIHDRGNFKKR
jgi:hypothetical protein